MIFPNQHKPPNCQSTTNWLHITFPTVFHYLFMFFSFCRRDGFMCTSGQCIEASEICDGFPDCVDKSDETPNLCSDIICPRYSYRCKYGACVHRNARCNQTEECFDGSDESNCNRGSTPKPPHGYANPSVSNSASH